MDLRRLNKICFTVCIVCIVLGAVLLLTVIWGGIEDNEFAWKSGLSLAVLFLAAILTLSVSNAFSGRTRGGDGEV